MSDFLIQSSDYFVSQIEIIYRTNRIVTRRIFVLRKSVFQERTIVLMKLIYIQKTIPPNDIKRTHLLSWIKLFSYIRRAFEELYIDSSHKSLVRREVIIIVTSDNVNRLAAARWINQSTIDHNSHQRTFGLLKKIIHYIFCISWRSMFLDIAFLNTKISY